MSKKQAAPARLLCPVCHDLRAIQTDADAITLTCGHSRGGLLPKAVGTVGLEDLDTPLGSKHFPHVLEVLPGFVERR
jgi:hypothetical protein